MPLRLGRSHAPEGLASRRYRRAAGVLMTRQGEELVLLDTRGERYYTLNDVGAVAWRALAGSATCAMIADAVRQEFDTSAVPDRGGVERDVARLLDQLLAAGLIAIDEKCGVKS